MTRTDPFTVLDRARRAGGAVLDALDLGPEPLPSDVVCAEPPARLRRFGASGDGPAVLLVPAPFKRAYIWDLEPPSSVVRVLGVRLPGSPAGVDGPRAGDRGVGLDEVVGRVLRTLSPQSARGGRGPVLLGHSLGGTFAALFAARHPESVRGLAMLEVPVRFGAEAGAFAPAVAASPHARWLAAAFGNVPGSFVAGSAPTW